MFAVGRNYPSPFRGSTDIAFELATESSVELVVYNLLGQEVLRLAYGRYRTGTYRVRWDGRDDEQEPVASGVYLFRVQTDRHISQTRTMVLRQ